MLISNHSVVPRNFWNKIQTFFRNQNFKENWGWINTYFNTQNTKIFVLITLNLTKLSYLHFIGRLDTCSTPLNITFIICQYLLPLAMVTQCFWIRMWAMMEFNAIVIFGEKKFHGHPSYLILLWSCIMSSFACKDSIDELNKKLGNWIVEWTIKCKLFLIYKYNAKVHKKDHYSEYVNK